MTPRSTPFTSRRRRRVIASLALKVAAAGKPCLVEKPMAMNHAECLQMVEAFRAAQRPLWVAYYRRALPRFLKVRELLRARAIGQLTSIHISVTEPLAIGDAAKAWRFNTEIAGAGLFLDLASHYFDIIDFLAGPITAAAGFALNTGGSLCGRGRHRCGVSDRRQGRRHRRVELQCAGVCRLGRVYRFRRGNRDGCSSPTRMWSSRAAGQPNLYRFRNPPHVHQPLIQTIVDELRGKGKCESTGESGARSAWVTDTCLASYYRETKNEQRRTNSS